jgi:hypothetical protein
MYQSATRSPHVSIPSPGRRPRTHSDIQVSASFPSPERHPHTGNEKQAISYIPTPRQYPRNSPERYPHTTNDRHSTQAFTSIPNQEHHPHAFPS